MIQKLQKNIMKKGIIVVLSMLSMAVFLSLPCLASVCTLLDLKNDSAGADLICTGRVVDFKTSTDGTSKSVEFRVDRVLKGKIEPGSVINIQCKLGQQHFVGYDLVLLKEQNGSYTFFRPEGSMAVSEALHSEYLRTENALENIRKELINSLLDTSEIVVQSALQQSSLLLPEDIDHFVTSKVNDSNLGIRALAFQAILATGNELSLIPALGLVEQFPKSDLPISLLLEIRNFQLNPKMIITVAQKSYSKNTTVRQLVSFMLRQTKNKVAAPYLQLLLNDPDSETRYNAVIGMAFAFGEKEHAPSKDKFDENEASYLKYWNAKALN